MTDKDVNMIYLWAHQRHIHGLTRYHRQGYDSLFPHQNNNNQNTRDKQDYHAVIVPFRKK